MSAVNKSIFKKRLSKKEKLHEIYRRHGIKFDEQSLVEKEIQDFYIGTLQKKQIDFVRIGNSATNQTGVPKSTAVFEDKKDQSCLKNFPDVMFPYGGQVYMREFSLMDGNQLKHKDRKEKQKKRMEHWHIHGKVNTLILATMEIAKEDIKKIIGENNV